MMCLSTRSTRSHGEQTSSNSEYLALMPPELSYCRSIQPTIIAILMAEQSADACEHPQGRAYTTVAQCPQLGRVLPVRYQGSLPPPRTSEIGWSPAIGSTKGV